MSRKLTPIEKQLIDKHFEFAELPRSYGPAGIYGRVQAFIDNGLAAALANHDSECEMADGIRRYCQCQDRRGYTYEDQPDGSLLIKANLPPKPQCRCTSDGTEPACPIHQPGMDISERDAPEVNP